MSSSTRKFSDEPAAQAVHTRNMPSGGDTRGGWKVAWRGLALLALGPSIAVAADAEYALRWVAAAGGPATAVDVAKLLGLSKTAATDFRVSYHMVERPSDAPAGFEPILRVRSRISKSGERRTETTFKYRGGASPPQVALHAWKCPLKQEEKRKDELDVSVVSTTQANRKFSRSCTAKGLLTEVVAKELKTKPRSCVNDVTQVEAKGALELDIEEWRVKGGVVLEVSAKGEATELALQDYIKQVVTPLVKAGVTPIDRSMTEIGSQCS